MALVRMHPEQQFRSEDVLVEEASLSVKNTFIHFQKTSNRSLRSVSTDPADPMPSSVAAIASQGEECGVDETQKVSVCQSETSVREEEEATLSVKNTFLHFQKASSRCLRRVSTEPADPPSERPSPASTRCATPPLSRISDTCTDSSSSDDEASGSIESTEPCESWPSTPESSPRSHAAAAPHFSTPLASTSSRPSTLQSSAIQAAGMASPPPSTSTSTSSTPSSAGYLTDAFKSLSGGQQSSFLEGGYCFSFSLRLADDVGLGVDFAPRWDGDKGLVVQGILQNGGLASWNKVCFDGTAQRAKAVWPGDTIVSVNGKTDYDEMMEDCRTKVLLKMTVFRPVGDGPSVGGIPMHCYWPSMHNGGLPHVPRPGQEGVRLHSCKKPVTLPSSSKP